MLIKLSLAFLILASFAKNVVPTTNEENDIANLKIAVSKLENQLEILHSEMRAKEVNIHREITKEEYDKLLADLATNKKEYQDARVERRKTRSDIVRLKTESESMKLTIQKLHTETSEIKTSFQKTLAQQEEIIGNISELQISIENCKIEHRDIISEISEINNKIQIFESQKPKKETGILQPQNDSEVSEDEGLTEGKECIQSEENAALCVQNRPCAFCFESDFRSSRCDHVESLNAKGCSMTEIMANIENEIQVGKITERSSGFSNLPVIPLCPGTKRNISLTFQIARIPIDVYVLVDNWAHRHMKRHPEGTLNLAAALKNTSLDYTLGFGISTDKPKKPFGLSSAFSFHNVLPLTKRVDEFSRSVRNYREISYWGDDADAQLEGIFQTANCKAQIGWRSNSRRILVVAAGSHYHVQGDGVKGDIRRSFDGLCAINGSGFYANELTQDYPSENQIVQAIKNGDINVIFALDTLGPTFEQYKSLAAQFDPPASVFLSNFAFKNLSNALIHGHHNINAVIDESQIPDDIRIKSYSHCEGKTTEETEKCSYSLNGEISLKLEIELLRCSPNASGQKRLLKINPKLSTLSSALIPTFAMRNCKL